MRRNCNNWLGKACDSFDRTGKHDELCCNARGEKKFEPTWLTPQRARKIWENRSSAGDFVGVVSREEDEEVSRVWQTMPGDTSWVDALLSISRGEHPRKEKP
jgi:hypothetical protein